MFSCHRFCGSICCDGTQFLTSICAVWQVPNAVALLCSPAQQCSKSSYCGVSADGLDTYPMGTRLPRYTRIQVYLQYHHTSTVCLDSHRERNSPPPKGENKTRPPPGARRHDSRESAYPAHDNPASSHFSQQAPPQPLALSSVSCTLREGCRAGAPASAVAA